MNFQTAIALTLATVLSLTAARAESPLLAPTRDAARYETAIEVERPATPPPSGVTGIMVPHHLVAPDLMARAFWAASSNDFERIILLSPDHFRAVEGAFGVATGDFDTIFGQVTVDTAGVERLLSTPTAFELVAPEKVAVEHGFHSLTPFIQKFWPYAQIIPVLGSIHSDLADWRAAAEALAPLVTDKTLIIQSTDFSHYLPRALAVIRDEESLGVIASHSVGEVRKLNQPNHLDSKASMAVNMLLQARLGAAPVVIGNRNQAEYGGDPNNTTSYLAAVWHRDAAAGARLRYDDQKVIYLAGDFFAGRYFEPHLADPAIAGALVEEMLKVTGGAPLVVNLEGVLLDQAVVGAPLAAHVMQTGIAQPILQALNVTAASLANNHANDLGEGGLAETTRLLGEIGVTPLAHGQVHDLGPVRIAAFSLLSASHAPETTERAMRAVEAICQTDAAPPLIVFVHWGKEYTRTSGPAERHLASQFSACGASAVIGHHSHQAARSVEAVRGGGGRMIYSLGNFLFDQRKDRADGALAELRIFKQGTTALRLIPIPNLFEMARGLAISD